METDTLAFSFAARHGIAAGIALVLLASASIEARAQEAEEAPAEEDVEDPLVPPLSPKGIPTPGDSTDSWIQLDSGEWMRGEIDKMRDDVLDFDSEKFDEQSFDWDDVVQVYSPRAHRYIRNFEHVNVGTAIIDRETVRIQSAGGEVVFPRAELTAILPGVDRELNRWSAYLGLSVDANYGASEQVSLTASAWLQREDYDSRTRLSFDAAWGQSDGTVNVYNAVMRLRSDLYVSHVFYYTPVDVGAHTDRFLNIAAQVVPGAGAGVQLVDEDTVELDLGGSVAYVFTKFDSVEAGEDLTSNDFGMRLNTQFEWEVTDDIDFTASHESLLIPTYFDLSSFTTNASLAFELFDDFDLNLAFRHLRVRDPVTEDDGTVPDQDQFQLTVGFGWTI